MAQATAGAPLDDRAVVRPSSLMERASRAIEEHPNALTKTALAAEVGGRNQSELKAIDRLVDLGHVETRRARGATSTAASSRFGNRSAISSRASSRHRFPAAGT